MLLLGSIHLVFIVPDNNRCTEPHLNSKVCNLSTITYNRDSPKQHFYFTLYIHLYSGNIQLSTITLYFVSMVTLYKL